MDKKNEKLVPIANSAYYCQVTGTLSVTLSGILIPMQIIYQGQTDRCCPKIKFPDEFNITHSVNHWSNEDKVMKLRNSFYFMSEMKKKSLIFVQPNGF